MAFTVRFENYDGKADGVSAGLRPVFRNAEIAARHVAIPRNGEPAFRSLEFRCRRAMGRSWKYKVEEEDGNQAMTNKMKSASIHVVHDEPDQKRKLNGPLYVPLDIGFN